MRSALMRNQADGAPVAGPCGAIKNLLLSTESLAQVLAEFARTLTTDFSIQKILDHIA